MRTIIYCFYKQYNNVTVLECCQLNYKFLLLINLISYHEKNTYEKGKRAEGLSSHKSNSWNH